METKSQLKERSGGKPRLSTPTLNAPSWRPLSATADSGSVVLARPTLLADKFRKICAAEEGRPTENGGVEFVVADVGIGACIEQKSRDVYGAAFDGHVQRGVIAVPHEPLGIDVDTVREQPTDGDQVTLVDRKMQGNGVVPVGADAAQRVIAQHRLSLAITAEIDHRQKVKPGPGRQKGGHNC